MKKRPRCLPATWLEEYARMERAIKESPPTKRQQPKVTRHQSARMRGVEQGQTPNTYRAMFGSDRYLTPTAPDEPEWWENKELPRWSTGKETGSRS